MFYLGFKLLTFLLFEICFSFVKALSPNTLIASKSRVEYIFVHICMCMGEQSTDEAEKGTIFSCNDVLGKKKDTDYLLLGKKR